MPQNKLSESAQLAFSEMIQQREAFEKALPQVRKEGAEALAKLMNVAQGHSGQSRIVASFLLSCYNGTRFKFDLTDFRALDLVIFEDCMKLLRMDYKPAHEVHRYFVDGSKVFEQMAERWSITDYFALEQKGSQ